MANKTQKSATPPKETFPRQAIPCPAGETDDEAGRNYADLVTSPELATLRVIKSGEASNIADGIDTPSLFDVLRGQAKAANDGDLSMAEAMLMNQSVALQTLFSRLVERAMGQSHLPNMEGLMRMALRAQNQCRMTLETLSTIKNPPVVYARQANVTTGPQQINNNMAAPSRAREIESEQSKLLEHTHGERLEPGTAQAASGTHPAMETVGAIHRTGE